MKTLDTDTAAQPGLDLDDTAAGGAASDALAAEADRLLALLEGRRWCHASAIASLHRLAYSGTRWDGRRIRRIVERAGRGRIVACPQRGYCRIDEARPEEIRHCLASLESRARKYQRRAQTIWTLLNKPDAMQREFPEDDAARLVHEVLLRSETPAWQTADQIRAFASGWAGVEIPERKIQATAETSEGWIIGHPARGYCHVWRASGPEIAAAWRRMIARSRSLEARLRDTRAAAHGLITPPRRAAAKS